MTYTKSAPCPVCGGWDNLPRGKGVRCQGYRRNDGKSVVCYRRESSHPTDDGGWWHPLESEAEATRIIPAAKEKPPLPPAQPCDGDPLDDLVVFQSKTPRGYRLAEEDVYPARNAAGQVVAVQATYRNSQGEKEPRPWTWDPVTGWQMNLRKTSPIFGLDALAARPNAPVLVVEGPKTLRAAQARFTDVVVVSPFGGKNGAKAVLEALKGRDKVTWWPDADRNGGSQKEFLAAAEKTDSKDVRVVALPDGLPDKWDLADPIPEWVDPEALLAAAVPVGRGDRPYPELPEIVFTPGKIADTIKRMQAVLSGVENLFSRGNDLVWIRRLKEPGKEGGISREAGAPSIAILTPPRLVEIATEQATWKKMGQKGKPYPADPPAQVIQAYLAGASERPHKPLTGLIETPTLRRDGSILNTRGYDDATGLYLIPSFDPLPIPDTLTRADALEALGVLLEPLDEFQFETDADRSVAVAAILTALIRRVIPAAPLFAFDAPKPRTGKSLLAQVIAIIATGRAAAMMGFPPEPQEFSKKIFAALLAGDQIVCIDNIPPGHAIESDTLCTALTEPIINDRILGKSENRKVPSNAVWLATGNNIAFARDVADRTLRCRLDAKMESPEHRHTRRTPEQLKASVCDRRAELIQAALIILRAYHQAGYPCQDDMSRFGGFDAWSQTVRGALVWLEMDDPCKTRLHVKADDPIRNSTEGLLTAWWDVFGEGIVTAAEVFKHKNTALQEAIEEAIGAGKDARELGKWCQRTVGGYYGGFALQKAGMTRNKSTRYAVKKTETQNCGYQTYSSPQVTIAPQMSL